jgi:predicted nucleotidyltransferase
MLSRTEENITRTLKQRLEEVAGDRLRSVIAYGSRVWGQSDSESDLDVAAIVDNPNPELEAALLDAAYQVNWDYDFTPLISLKIFDAENFAKYLEKDFSFYRKISQEGISL